MSTRETPTSWYARQQLGGDPAAAGEAFLQALGLPRPQSVQTFGSPQALLEELQVGASPLYDALKRTLGRYRPHREGPDRWHTDPLSILDGAWRYSGPGRQLSSRIETTALALNGRLGDIRGREVELYSLGISPSGRGTARQDPIPGGFNLDRFWGLLYAADILEADGWEPPAWRDALAALVKSAGWSVLQGSKLLLADRPRETFPLERVPSIGHGNLWPEGWSLGELPHRGDGPALTWPDGSAVWAWQGQPVPREAIESPDRLTPEMILAETDPRRRRLLIERRGAEALLDDPRLEKEARQVFRNRYVRLTLADLPSQARPWPEELPEPARLTRWTPHEMPGGLYYKAYPSGQLSLVAASAQGTLHSFLLLEDGQPMGYHSSVQYYYWNGLIEDFSPYDDDSDPEPATMSFQAWVQGYLGPIVQVGSRGG